MGSVWSLHGFLKGVVRNIRNISFCFECFKTKRNISFSFCFLFSFLFSFFFWSGIKGNKKNKKSKNTVARKWWYHIPRRTHPEPIVVVGFSYGCVFFSCWSCSYETRIVPLPSHLVKEKKVIFHRFPTRSRMGYKKKNLIVIRRFPCTPMFPAEIRWNDPSWGMIPLPVPE